MAEQKLPDKAQENEMKREKVRVVPIKYIDDSPDHPFQVRDDEEMMSLVESIATFGVITPIIARKTADERYELISGHRRKRACELLHIDTLPIIVRDLSREEGIILMVDSNLQREHILPSEKAFAYKMKMDALRRTAGRPSKDNSVPVAQNLGKTTREVVAEESGESQDQIRRYVRLTELIPQLLQMVDEGKIAFRPAVELSYLEKEEQEDLLETIESEDCTPSLAQAIRMKGLSRDMERQREESREFLNDLVARDQRMIPALITIVHTADSKEQLDADTESIRQCARKHLCSLNILRWQQLEGLNTVLPYGVPKLTMRRTLTTESLAVFMPFRVQEVTHRNGIYFANNAISKNMIMVNRGELLNGNSFITGVSGSGKSLLAKQEIINLFLSDNG